MGKTKPILRGGNKCDSHPHGASLYDGEDYGALAITEALLLTIHPEKRSPSLSFTAYIDNEALVKTFNNITKGGNLSHKEPCFEVFLQIQCNLKCLAFNGKWEWVEGHQDKIPELKHILNCKAYKLAKNEITNQQKAPNIYP